MKKVGVIGCGLMGAGMVRNLLHQQFDVIVFDINEAMTTPLVEAGATKANEVTSLAREVDAVIVSLPSPQVIYDVLTKDVFPHLRENAFVLDMSTNDVEITRQLNTMASKNNIYFYDCPLSGGPAGANAGSLTIMVGGLKERFSDIRPILQAIGETIEYIGESGAGQIVKLCNNMMVGGIISLASETLQVGEKLGVDKARIIQLMQQGSAQTKVMDVFGPSILRENFDDVTFSLANMMKDIHLYQSMGEQAEVNPSISKSIVSLYESAIKAGKGAKDATAVYNEIS